MDAIETRNSVASTASDAPASFLVRIRDVLFAPSRGFARVARAPGRLWQPLLLMAIVNTVPLAVFYDQLVVPEQRRAVAARGLGAAETAEAERLFLSPTLRFATSAIGFLSVPVISIAVALVAYLGAAYLLTGNGTFLGSWAAVSHALLVGLVELAIKLPVMLSQGRLEVFFGPALLLSQPDRSKFLHAFLMSLDVFTAWKLVLAGIGVAIAHGIRARGQVIGFLLGAWVLFEILHAALTSALAG
jgi:hypothetical protein